MHKYNLSFISDKDLLNHTIATVEKYRFDIDLDKFNQNLIDPIKLTFDSKIYQKSIRETIEIEVLRQIDKSNTNHIGYFHQNIFKYINPKWEVPERGFDLINQEDKIYVEMKNKHNTMNSSSSQRTYMKMQSILLEDADNRCMLVEIIASKSQNIPWRVSLDGISKEHEFIRRVSIDKFYEIVTGEADSFKNLCEILPTVINDAIETVRNRSINNTVLQELEEISPNLFESLYLLSFKTYEGFQELNFKDIP